MAENWIKMRTNLDTNPHVIEMAELLGVPELHVVGMLWKVWSWADTHSLDGNAIRVTNVTLDRYTCVTGFAQALRKVGWLEGEDGQLTLPRFCEHNGQTAKKRAETARRVEKHRNAKPVTNVTQNALPDKIRLDKSRSNTLSHTPACASDWESDPLVLGSPELADAIRFWVASYSSAHATSTRDDDGIRICLRLAEATGRGWSVEKIIRSIKFSVTKVAKSWLDPDVEFATGGRSKKEPVPLAEKY